MNDIPNLAMVQQLLENIENDLRSAKEIIQKVVSSIPEAGSDAEKQVITSRARGLSVLEGGRIIEGVFDGQNMVGPDGRMYPVPANYASKSKLVEGDVLKLTIAPDGSFVYKQIGPVERKRILGTLVKDDKGDLKVVAEGKAYKVLLASLTYYKAEPGDQVTLLVPTDQESSWAAVENVIKAGETAPAAAPVYNEKHSGGDEETEEEGSETKQVRIVTGDDDED